MNYIFVRYLVIKCLFVIMLATLFTCQKNKGFSINGKLNGDTPKYVYMTYGKIRDSAIVEDGRFYFKGKVDYPIRAGFYILPVSTLEDPFYIENTTMKIEMTVKKKKYKGIDLNFIKVDTIMGTETKLIQNNFEDFKKKHSSEPNWNDLLFNKLSTIIRQNPQNGFSGDILASTAKDSVLDIDKLKKLYELLDMNSQSKHSLATIRNIVNPKSKISIGNKIIDFELPNQYGVHVNTKKYREALLLIDFWASWCIPCRKQNKELVKVYNKFKGNPFNVLGVSIDTDKNKWINAIKKDGLPWDNVIDISGFDGEVAATYNLSYSVPHNFLVDSEGKIIAKDIKIEDLENLLKNEQN